MRNQCAPRPGYLEAHSKFYSIASELDSLQQTFKAAGIEVEIHNDGKHWVLSRDGLRINYWPSANKAMTFARVWRTTSEGLITAFNSGCIKLPEKARSATCRQCGSSIWWLKTDRGRWMAVQADGDGHFSRCPAETPS